MDDSYEGSSREISESTTETGSESSTGDSGEASTITQAETADAFDETGKETGATDPETSTGVESKTEKGSSFEAPVASDKEEISNAEISAAFDEESPGKMETPVAPDTKVETVSGKTETKSLENSKNADAAETIHVNCTREDLAGKEHPETGVSYETKVVEVNGKQLEVTVPKFESNYDFKLDSDQLQLDRQKHNDICNAKLKEYCEQNPDWASETFSQKQLDQIKSGKNPEGYTWHHDGGEVGHMQLVDSKIHHDTRHTGGIAIWGNKSKYT